MSNEYDHEINCELLNGIVAELKSRLRCISLEWVGQQETNIDKLKTKLINEIDFTKDENISIKGASQMFSKIENDICEEALSYVVILLDRVKEK